MGIRIIADSSCDMTQEMKELTNPLFVPFIVNLADGDEFVDDGSRSTLELIAALARSKEVAKSTCPSPETYLNAIEQCGEDDCFIITISSKLSGSYNAACVGKDMALEKNPHKNIYILDSKAAVVAETKIALYLHEQIMSGKSFSEIAESCENFIRQMRTYFVLEDLDNLFKNGRLTKVAGRIAAMVKLCPVMGEDGDGNIKLISPSLGIERSLRKLVETVSQHGEQFKAKSVDLLIAHCNCAERAQKVKQRLLNKCACVKDVTLVPTGILSSMYANNGGIVIAF